MSRLWTLSVLGLIAVLAIACSDEGEDNPPSTSSFAVLTTTLTATTAPAPSATAAVVPSVSEWATYSPSGGGVTIRFPSLWHSIPGGGITSWDTSTWDKPYFPPGATKVDVIYGPTSQAEPKPSGATDVTNPAGAGWELVSYPTEDSDGVSRVHQLTLMRGDFTLSLIAYYSSPEAPDSDATFEQMASSISFQ